MAGCDCFGDVRFLEAGGLSDTACCVKEYVVLFDSADSLFTDSMYDVPGHESACGNAV